MKSKLTLLIINHDQNTTQFSSLLLSHLKLLNKTYHLENKILKKLNSCLITFQLSNHIIKLKSRSVLIIKFFVFLDSRFANRNLLLQTLLPRITEFYYVGHFLTFRILYTFNYYHGICSASPGLHRTKTEKIRNFTYQVDNTSSAFFFLNILQIFIRILNILWYYFYVIHFLIGP